MEDGWDPGDPSQVATFAKDEDRAGPARIQHTLSG